MGMVYLLGQLDTPADPKAAIPLLKQSADLSDVDAPQSAYVYGMLLLGEFAHVDLPSHLLAPYLPTANVANLEPRVTEARRYIERSAYLNFSPAQYKAGWAYEYAKMGCAFDPLLSVQYYSLASQQGEEEADMALSKWFLCGAEGCFDKDEHLAFTFAEKAARKGLPAAEFAMGYYFEVGVGGRKDLAQARKWYEKVRS
jgi:TPR repeat protein